ncbi:UNVERIFIED_CONTAM: hypothetical protein Scaly_1207400 [Sesamum calycinum]|uniref:Uncharacterized protein n=1 Tax=Sesamum calycinum TaxID=2727403 RepID=A0AAW2Q4A5_9LAMI
MTLKTDIRLVKKTVASGGTEAPRVLDAKKVSNTSMYLTGDTKLWWCSCLSDDASTNRERIETLNAIAAEQIDDERETELARMGAMQLEALQVQFRGCGETHQKGLMIVAGRINGKKMKALVDTGTTNNFVSDRVVHRLGLDVKPWDNQLKAVNSQIRASKRGCQHGSVGSWSGQRNFIAVGLGDFDAILDNDFFVTADMIILPRLGGIFISGRNKPIFVKGEYDGGTTTGKQSEMTEARPSNASSSNKGAHSPRLADFSYIGKIIRDGKQTLVQSTSEMKENKTAASTRTSTSVGGGEARTGEQTPVCRDIRQVVRTDADSSRQADRRLAQDVPDVWTCDEAVKDENRRSTWQLRNDADKAIIVFHGGCKQF